MAAETGAAIPRPTAALRVAVSSVSELTFALFVIRQGSKLHQRRWVELLAGAPLGLLQAIRDFWDDEYPEWGEVELLAEASGHLFDEDPVTFIAGFERIAAERIEVPALPSEGEAVREIIVRRLAALRDSPDLRARLAGLLRDLWAVLAPAWTATGLASARAHGADLERRLRETNRLTAVVPSYHLARREQHAATLREAVARGTAVLVPFGLAEAGQCLFSAREWVVIAFGPATARRIERRRERGKAAAARFKVLADPTRLALLNYMVHAAITITDMAAYFELSQPTVSVHVKILREAGLLTAVRDGAHTLYRADPGVIRQFVATGAEAIVDDRDEDGVVDEDSCT
jgi:DNA-binding transcriptional ArsR family regulator